MIDTLVYDSKTQKRIKKVLKQIIDESNIGKKALTVNFNNYDSSLNYTKVELFGLLEDRSMIEIKFHGNLFQEKLRDLKLFH